MTNDVLPLVRVIKAINLLVNTNSDLVEISVELPFYLLAVVAPKYRQVS